MVGEKRRENSPRRFQCREMNMVVAERCSSVMMYDEVNRFDLVRCDVM
jgi:hypothetical protein